MVVIVVVVVLVVVVVVGGGGGGGAVAAYHLSISIEYIFLYVAIATCYITYILLIYHSF